MGKTVVVRRTGDYIEKKNKRANEYIAKIFAENQFDTSIELYRRPNTIFFNMSILTCLLNLPFLVAKNVEG